MWSSLLLSIAFLYQTPLAQNQPANENDRGPREERRRRFDRPGDEGVDNPEERQRRRERWQRYRDASPEERRKLRTERMLEMTARTYELDDAQKEQVRAEMDRMQQERRAQMGPMADEYDQLRDQMFEFWRSAGDDEAGNADGRGRRDRMREMRDDPEFQALRNRMREIEEKYPMDFEAAAQRIEALLPPGQAEKGRQRRMEWMQRREGRRDERQAGREMQQIVRALREGNPPPAGVDLERFLNEANRRLSDPNLTDEQRNAIRKALEAASRGAAQQPASGEAPAAPAARSAPVHPWEKYVADFIARYELTEAQRASAAAILKEALARADRIEAANASRRAEAEKLTDAKQRQDRLRRLDDATNQVYVEMQRRLDNLLTAAQRSKGAAPKPESRRI